LIALDWLVTFHRSQFRLNSDAVPKLCDAGSAAAQPKIVAGCIIASALLSFSVDHDTALSDPWHIM
jgi:hypothetical protein